MTKIMDNFGFIKKNIYFEKSLLNFQRNVIEFLKLEILHKLVYMIEFLDKILLYLFQLFPRITFLFLESYHIFFDDFRRLI